MPDQGDPAGSAQGAGGPSSAGSKPPAPPADAGNLNPKGELQRLRLLYEVSEILSHTVDIRDIAEPIMEALAERMGMSRGTITLLNRDTNEIVIEMAHGLSPEQARRGRYRMGEGITGKVVATGQPAVVPRISKEPLFLDRTRSRSRIAREDVSFICVPIKLGQEVFGALSADRLYSEEIDLHEDVRLLTTIGAMIAQAVKLRRETMEERQRLQAENERLRTELIQRWQPDNIIGRSNSMQKVYDLVGQVAPSAATVLVRGESGTGKELVAHAIHASSPRAGRPFIKVNCAALPETILESELFGHEKGSFTGAVNQRRGRFELADGGTIFLDEIGDFPPTAQIRLLRVLQEREFERVGGAEPIKVNVRVIAATNRNLEEAIQKGQFREDLYYRLNVFPIFIPPLRERKTDIPLLMDYFLEKFSQQNHKQVRRISTPAIDMLMSYHWPGNVRELENCIERAVLVAEGDVIRSIHLPPTLQMAATGGTEAEGESEPRTLKDRVGAFERELLIEALKSARGNMAKAARTLHTTERILSYRVRSHNLDPHQYKS